MNTIVSYLYFYITRLTRRSSGLRFNTTGQDISEIIIEVSKVTDSVAIGFVISGVIIFIVGLLGVVGACCLSKPILVLVSRQLVLQLLKCKQFSLCMF